MERSVYAVNIVMIIICWMVARFVICATIAVIHALQLLQQLAFHAT